MSCTSKCIIMPLILSSIYMVSWAPIMGFFPSPLIHYSQYIHDILRSSISISQNKRYSVHAVCVQLSPMRTE